MQAIVQDRYGGPEVLELREVPDPVPGHREVRLRVTASSVNAADWHMMRGDPRVARLSIGVRRPRAAVRGRDVVGVVDALGPGVTRWQVGDAVYGDLGDGSGAFAELACAHEDWLGRPPAGLSPEQCAAVPLAAKTALFCLRDAAGLTAGQRVIVIGASGGVGTYAVQLAAHLGADVTAVCSTRNVDLVRSLGADEVVDYTREPLTGLPAYDVVLDLAGTRRLRDLVQLATPHATLVLSGGGTSEGGSLLGPVALMLRAQLTSRWMTQQVRIPQSPPDGTAMGELTHLVEAGALRPVVERTYKLAEVPDALRYVESEHARAKVAVSVAAS